MINKNYYRATEQNCWTGRNDGDDSAQMRWWQIVQAIQLSEIGKEELEYSLVFLGFECDEGVARNKGRVGAIKGPESLRKVFSNLPVHFFPFQKIVDLGNIICTNKNLEEAQKHLSMTVAMILEKGGFPFLLGGGHEILYGHSVGVRKNYPHSYANRRGELEFTHAPTLVHVVPSQTGRGPARGRWPCAVLPLARGPN